MADDEPQGDETDWHFTHAEMLAHDAALLAAQPATADREALEDELFKHRPITSMKDGSIAGCSCMDRVFVKKVEDWDSHVADRLFASGVIVPANNIRAEEAELAAIYADQWGDQNEEGGYARSAHSIAHAIRSGALDDPAFRARAAELRGNA